MHFFTRVYTAFVPFYFIVATLQAADMDIDIPILSYGAASTQGKRKTMEDRIIMATGGALKNSVLGVLDGHGGDTIANAIYNFLHVYQELGWFDHINENKIKKLFSHMQDNIITSLGCDAIQRVGCTAALVFLSPGKAYCAQLGDSHIINSNGDVVIEPHTVLNQKEIVRVGPHNIYHNEHTTVRRLGGRLIVTRSFGDLQLLASNISVEPEVVEVPFLANDFFVIASDGVTDFLNPNNIARFTRQRSNDNAKPYRIARELLIMAASLSADRKRSPFFVQDLEILRDFFYTLHDVDLFNNDDYTYLKQACDNQTVVVVHRS